MSVLYTDTEHDCRGMDKTLFVNPSDRSALEWKSLKREIQIMEFEDLPKLDSCGDRGQFQSPGLFVLHCPFTCLYTVVFKLSNVEAYLL